MDTVIKIIGLLFIGASLLYMIKPNIMKRIMDFFKQGRRIYFAGVIRLVLAVIFLLGARECDIAWVIAAFGILFIISGLLVFIIGTEKLKTMLEWYQQQSLLLLRSLAGIGVLIGLAVIYAA